MSDLPNKVTKEDLEHLVAQSKTTFTNPAGTLTHCVITLPCGYTVTGESACVDPANYDKELGEKYALEQAVEKLWPLEGYLLAWRLHSRAEWLNNQTGDLPVGSIKDACSCKAPKEACSNCPKPAETK